MLSSSFDSAKLRSTCAPLLAILCMAVAAIPAWSQSNSSTILGAVTDPQGNVVAGSAVTLTNEGTGAQRSAVTDQTGNFTFPALLPGSYTAKVESCGFQTYRKI